MEDSVSSYVKAIELRANYAIANNNLGNALSLSGKYDEAIKSFKTTAKMEPESHIPKVRLCDILQSRGKFNDAIDVLVINLKR